jgi:hypothetical protein
MQSWGNDYQLHSIVGNSIDFVWELIAPYLADAVNYSDGKYSLEGVKKMIRDRQAFLFFVSNKTGVMGVLVLRINEYECSRRACLFLLGGKSLDEWMEFFEQIKKWVMQADCDAIELFGRPGWERKLEKFGFEKTHVLLRLNLKEKEHVR